jgi:hypothetical protein
MKVLGPKCNERSGALTPLYPVCCCDLNEHVATVSRTRFRVRNPAPKYCISGQPKPGIATDFRPHIKCSESV